jgi:hypothetical protein
MKEARIVMPENTGINESVVHTALTQELLEAFGGFTSHRGQGAWLDNGKTVWDDVVIYDIACDENRDYTYDKLFEIAQRAGRALDQQAVYIRYPDGFVEIANIGETEHHHALDIAAREAVEATLDRDAVTADMGDGRSALVSETDRLYKELTGRAHGQTVWDDPRVAGAVQATADRMAGIKRVPHVGELWYARTGELVAVMSQASILDGGYNCVTLTKGGTAVNPGRVFVCNLDGQFGAATARSYRFSHPLDLVSYHGNFLVP